MRMYWWQGGVHIEPRESGDGVRLTDLFNYLSQEYDIEKWELRSSEDGGDRKLAGSPSSHTINDRLDLVLKNINWCMEEVKKIRIALS